MLSFAWAQIRAYPARLTAVLLAIALGSAFLAATAVFLSTSAAGLRVMAAAPLSAADVVVDRDPEAAGHGPDWPGLVAGHPEITAVSAFHARTLQLVTDDQRATTNVYSISNEPDLRWFDLSEGSWPTSPDQVVADSATLGAAGLALGDAVRLVPSEGAESQAVVVGVADLAFQPLTGVQYQLYAPEEFFAGDTPASALALVSEGASASSAVEDLAASLPEGLYAITAAEQAELAADRFAGGSQQLTLVLLVFALIALIAAAMVIANTFTILLAQRRRDTALLRLVGADRSQVRNLVVTESLIMGTTGSLIGVATGVGAGYAAAAMMGLTGAGLAINPVALAGAFLVSVGTTVCAAWFPARRAASTAPVEALRSSSIQGAFRFGRVHLVGTLVAVAGLVTMGAGALTGSLPLAIGGGFVGAIGLLMALRYVISALIRVADPLLRRMGGIAGLAGANLRRNTGRAATATLTLVLGLGLITALTTAAATGRATIDNDLSNRYPVDVTVRADTGSVDPGTVGMIAEIAALDFVEAVRTSEARVGELGSVTLVGVSPEAARAAGADALADGGADPPVMLVSAEQLGTLAADGQGGEVSVAVGGEERTFTLVVSNLATVSGTAAPVVLDEVLDSLAAGTGRGMVWGVAGPDADLGVLAERMTRIAAADPDIHLNEALSERRDITEILDILVNLSLAMLLVTVVIAVIGVTNTLGLSVLERTRESALLRALGLTRAGLRGTLAVEATVIVVLGALLGILIGVPYGLVGVDAIVGATAPLVVSVPWTTLGLVLLSVLAIGTAATVLPARRAARVAPAEGLSGD